MGFSKKYAHSLNVKVLNLLLFFFFGKVPREVQLSLPGLLLRDWASSTWAGFWVGVELVGDES